MNVLDYISKNENLKKYFEKIPDAELVKHCKLEIYKPQNNIDKKGENLNFIGGELIVFIQPTKSNIFCLDLKLYFQNNNDEIILKEKHKELDFYILDENSKNELMEKKTITYEVNAPSQE